MINIYGCTDYGKEFYTSISENDIGKGEKKDGEEIKSRYFRSNRNGWTAFYLIA